MDNLPQDLTKLTPEQHEKSITFLSSLPLPELRRRQAITREQLTVAFMERNDLAMRNLQVRDMHLLTAICSKLDEEIRSCR